MATTRLILLMMLGCGCPAPGRAADFPVASVAGFNAAVASAEPGDTITLADGTWANTDLVFKGDGTPTSPITLRAQTPGRVFLSGVTRMQISGSFLIVSGLVFANGYPRSEELLAFRENLTNFAYNCRVSDCAFINFNPPFSFIDAKWVALYGFSNRVDHCYFTGKLNAGTVLSVFLPPAGSAEALNPNYHSVDHNRFGPRPPLGVNGGETVRIGDSATSFNVSHTIVENNYFEQCSGDIEFISSKSCENVYRYNTFVDCEGALTLRHGNRCTVEGNYFFGHNKISTGGVRIMGEDHKVINNYFQDLGGSFGRSALTIMQGLENSPLNGWFQVKNALIAFNTFVNCSNNLLIGMPATYSVNGVNRDTTLPPLNCTIANNVVWATRNLLVDQRLAPVNLTWEGNIMFGTALGIGPPNGILLTNPLLVQDADGLWRPSSNSPALATAQGSYDFVTEDIKGAPRPAVKDIGADQQTAEPPQRRPLTAADVGPRFPPTVAITAPATGAALYEAKPFTVRADASDLDGTVTRVEFLVNDNSVGTDTAAPFQATFALVVGNYVLTTVATDNVSLNRTSAPVSVTVLPQQPPIVNIIAPATGATFLHRGLITVRANASDLDGVVRRVEFFADGNSVGTDTNAPFEVSFTRPSGDHVLTALATDDDSRDRTSAPVNVTVLPPEPPRVALAEPANGAAPLAGRPIHVLADASDVDGVVTRVEFFANGNSIGTDNNSPYEVIFMPPAGEYALTAVATDDESLNRTSAFANVTVRTPQPPNVDIAEPGDGATFLEGWPIRLTANANDPDRSVTQVQFFANGLLLRTDRFAPYQADWTPAPGDYALIAVALDDDGLAATSAVVNVSITAVTLRGFQESGGLVVMEAEHADTKTTVSGHTWLATNNVAGFIGDSAMQSLPNNGANPTANIQTSSPSLTYQVQFTTTGTYKFWIRGWAASGSDDSIYIGVDGQSPQSLSYGQTAAWMWKAGQITIPSAGLHEINLWMREDGAYVDRLLLTTNLTFTPTAAGPTESPHVSGATNLPPSAVILTPADGAFLLQGAPIVIRVNASDADGVVKRVEFFVNGNSISVATNAPYETRFSPALGDYVLTAVATDADSASTTSMVVALSIGPPPPNFPALFCLVENSQLTLRYQLPPELEFFDVVVEKSTDLVNWTLAESLFEQTTGAPGENGSETITRRVRLNQLTNRALFFRLAQRHGF